MYAPRTCTHFQGQASIRPPSQLKLTIAFHNATKPLLCMLHPLFYGLSGTKPPTGFWKLNADRSSLTNLGMAGWEVSS